MTVIPHCPPTEFRLGQFLWLQFGNGSQLVRVEGITGKRLRIRRLEGRGTKGEKWKLKTTTIRQDDPRICAEAPAYSFSAPLPTVDRLDWCITLLEEDVRAYTALATKDEPEPWEGYRKNKRLCAARAAAGAKRRDHQTGGLLSHEEYPPRVNRPRRRRQWVRRARRGLNAKRERHLKRSSACRDGRCEPCASSHSQSATAPASCPCCARRGALLSREGTEHHAY